MTNSTSSMFRRLAFVQHVLFVLLVVLGVGRALVTGVNPFALGATVALLLGWYLIGARRASTHTAAGSHSAVGNHGAAGSHSAVGNHGAVGNHSAVGTNSTRGTAAVDGVPNAPQPSGDEAMVAGLGHGGWWFIGLIVCWLVTVAVSAENIWVAFSLWLLAGHLLPWRLGALTSVLVLGVVIARPGPDGLDLAGIVGPTVGMIFAFALSRGQQLLVDDSIERERLVASLVAAQAETEELHAELAETQRAAGVLAERSRLSRDIHDTLAQGFSSIVLLARAGAATEDGTSQRRLLQQIEDSAVEGLGEARGLISQLAPTPLQSGLADALERIAHRLATETGLEATVRVDGEVALPVAGEIALLRVAQSALANVRQHAAATRVVITLTDLDDSIRLDIADNGRGFDPGSLDRGVESGSGGYGLRASRQRMRELGGGLDIESEDGAGTVLSAHLPRTLPAVGTQPDDSPAAPDGAHR